MRIASQGGRLLKLVLVGGIAVGLAGCDKRRPVSRASVGASAQGHGGEANGGAPGGTRAPERSPAENRAGSAPVTGDEWVTLHDDVEPWLLAALHRQEASGALDLDLPLAMHLPLLASPRANFITPRQVMEHTAHLGARAYEDFLRANPGSDALKAQAFLVALGADETPGERREWRRAHLDLMSWLLLALTREPDLAAALSASLGQTVRLAETESLAITPIRRPISVPADRHEEIQRAWGSDR